MSTLPGRDGRSSLARRLARHPAYRDLEVVYEGYSESIPFRPPDLSVRGMFINTTRPFPEGAVLKLSFRLGRSNCEIKARGEVRYCLPGVGIGVEFIDISPECQQAIELDLAGR